MEFFILVLLFIFIPFNFIFPNETSNNSDQNERISALEYKVQKHEALISEIPVALVGTDKEIINSPDKLKTLLRVYMISKHIGCHNLTDKCEQIFDEAFREETLIEKIHNFSVWLKSKFNKK